MGTLREQGGARRAALAVVALLAAWWAASASAQIEIEQAPIRYLDPVVSDSVSRLQARIDAGTVELAHDKRRGYLESVLEHLDVPASSQMLVFSKTSFQLRRISRHSPRALYFSDDVYIGWVRGGEVMEISAVDPEKGANFYTLSQQPAERPRFVRQTYECLQCHSSSLSRGVPGHIVRSVYPAPDGRPILRAGTFRTDHTSPLRERWGGWYVTGTHGAQRHMGNAVLGASEEPEDFDFERGANVADLRHEFETSSYLTPHSDIVALMVLEHQAQMHNLITQASFLTRIALEQEQVMNEALGRPAGHRSESTRRRIRAAAEPLVGYLLFAGEASLTAPITGTSGFAEAFAARGPRDQRGRSLREFDLTRRLFRFPLSYIIYSEAFDALPPTVLEDVYGQLWAVLSGEDTRPDFAHLSAADRRAILEILRDTKEGLPPSWREEEAPASAGRRVHTF